MERLEPVWAEGYFERMLASALWLRFSPMVTCEWFAISVLVGRLPGVAPGWSGAPLMCPYFSCPALLPDLEDGQTWCLTVGRARY